MHRSARGTEPWHSKETRERRIDRLHESKTDLQTCLVVEEVREFL